MVEAFFQEDSKLPVWPRQSKEEVREDVREEVREEGREEGDSWGLSTSQIVNREGPAWDINRGQFTEQVASYNIRGILITTLIIN